MMLIFSRMRVKKKSLYWWTWCGMLNKLLSLTVVATTCHITTWNTQSGLLLRFSCCKSNHSKLGKNSSTKLKMRWEEFKFIISTFFSLTRLTWICPSIICHSCYSDNCVIKSTWSFNISNARSPITVKG